jgi:antitoxin (DNA-binding transcriptional repressor) of toxin-antitoxin stability system
MHQVDISQATSSPESLFQTALLCDEVVITQNNEPILKIVRLNQPQIPLNQPKKRRQSGSAKGLIWMSDDFDAPLEELREYME